MDLKFKNWNINSKFIIPISLIVIIGSIIIFFYWTNLYKQNRIDIMVNKAKSIIYSAESVRDFTSRQQKFNIFKDSIKDLDKVLHTVPIFSAMVVVKENAEKLNYKFKVPKVSPRNPENEPDEYELKILQKFKNSKLKEFWEIDENTEHLRFFRPIKLSKECLLCHGDPSKSMEYWGNDKGLDITGTKMEGWKEGEIHGAFEIMMDLSEMYAQINKQTIIIFALTLSFAIVIILIAIIISRKISGPIKDITKISNQIATGNIDVEVISDSKDEIGLLLKAYENLIQYFKQQIKAIESLSKGDFDIDITPKSDKDVLSKSILKVTDSLKNIVAETSKVINNVKVGRLDIRGDTSQIEGDWKKLISGINDIIASFGQVLLQITQSVDSVARSAMEISDNTETIAASAEELNKQTDEVAFAIDEMSKTINENAMATTETDRVAQENGRIAQEGGDVVRLTIQKMQEIAEVVERSAIKIESLGKSGDAIGEIISVIEDIADQTNLLALNAAIEAARAGEQGRGFAVVADEVRKLAERTTDATKEISKMIKGIQAETSEAVNIMNVTNEEVKNGIQLADQAGNALQQIVNSSQDLLDKIAQIASASEEQSSTSKVISQNVFSISEVTSDTVKRIADIARAIAETSELAKNIIDTLNQYKIDGGKISSNYDSEFDMITDKSTHKQLTS